jgi:hypothetical protein
MSSSNRGYEKHKSDYYVTPINVIYDLIDALPEIFKEKTISRVLDPCAGGGEINGNTYGMPYPDALSVLGYDIHTLDMRTDSLADEAVDFLEWACPDGYVPDLVISNPPFSLAKEFIEKSLGIVNQETGVVIMLQRLNFLGSAARDAFWENNPPSVVVVHAKRISFGGTTGTDSIEYAHFVWDKAYNGPSVLKRIKARK